eukprot:scaffold1184_cov98-Skeletonema_dohrnii-CCMP3373.AAC.2
MAVYRDSGGRLRCLIRSPTTLKRRRYEHAMLEPCKRCFYAIMANYYEFLEAVERHIHSVRYDMVRERRAGSWRLSQMPHQVTSEAVATPIQACNA